MNSCMYEKDCHESCTRCDDFLQLEEEIQTLKKIIMSYEDERKSLLEKNWELQRKISEAEKQIDSELKDLALTKNFIVALKEEYDRLENHCKNLEVKNGKN